MAQLPVRADEGCGGWDVIATEVIKEADDFYVCKLGLKMQPENPNYKIALVPRSSLTKTKWILQNSPALGDWSFTGEYELRFRALPIGFGVVNGVMLSDKEYREMHRPSLIYPEFPFKVGDRIGQIYLEEVIPIEFDEETELIETSRGEGGFGSTGK